MKGQTFSVLDNGFARLVDYMGSDLSIVRAARVSYQADWRAGEDEGSDRRLIGYLYRNHHTTPFEAVTFSFEIKAPLFVFAQWHRHRTWSYNQISARYTELDEGFYIPALDQITTQSTSNKQMRTKEQHPEAEAIRETIRAHCQAQFRVYKQLLDAGCPRELARSVLPTAAYSRMFASVDLHNLFHFLRLRMHSHAQYEIRVYAEALLELITPVVPCAVAAFKNSLGEGFTTS